MLRPALHNFRKPYMYTHGSTLKSHGKQGDNHTGITPSALLRHINTTAPRKIMCGKKDPALAPTCTGHFSHRLTHMSYVQRNVVTATEVALQCCSVLSALLMPLQHQPVLSVHAVRMVIPCSVQPASDIIQCHLCNMQ